MKVIFTSQEFNALNNAADELGYRNIINRKTVEFKDLERIKMLDLTESIVLVDGTTATRMENGDYIFTAPEGQIASAIELLNRLRDNRMFWNALESVVSIGKSIFGLIMGLKPAVKMLEKIVFDEVRQMEEEEKEKTKAAEEEAAGVSTLASTIVNLAAKVAPANSLGEAAQTLQSIGVKITTGEQQAESDTETDDKK